MRKLVLLGTPVLGILAIALWIWRFPDSQSSPPPAPLKSNLPLGERKGATTSTEIHSTPAPSSASSRVDSRVTFSRQLANAKRARELLVELGRLEQRSTYRIWELSVELRSLSKADPNVLDLVLARLEQADCAEGLRVALLGVLARLGTNQTGSRLARFIQPEFSENVRLAGLHALTKTKFSAADAISGTDLSGDTVDLSTHGHGDLFYDSPEIAGMIAGLIYTESSPQLLTSMVEALLTQEIEVKYPLANKVSEMLKSSGNESQVNACVTFLASMRTSEWSNEVSGLATNDPRPAIRSNALRALGVYSPDAFAATLTTTMKSDTDPSVIEYGLFLAMQTVVDEEGGLSGPNQTLVRELRGIIETVAFQHSDSNVRLLGINSLTHIAHESHVIPLINSMQGNPSAPVRARAAYALGLLRHNEGTNRKSAALVEQVLRDQLLIEKSVEVQESIKSAIAGN